MSTSFPTVRCIYSQHHSTTTQQFTSYNQIQHITHDIHNLVSGTCACRSAMSNHSRYKHLKLSVLINANNNSTVL